jgi:hypothetical protein
MMTMIIPSRHKMAFLLNKEALKNVFFVVTFCSWNLPSCHVGLVVDTPVNMYGVSGNVKAG